ncbi:esterase-like activity of phytase family protein [filamentous cyanobacterium LEGE 11480]|uniref:Esterase-like activity of phytase family protein n=1 Tax=Romeriopsis navalis LEGE 11480 TaxID=2777977 RepID=A0A928Z272_9CYAN|nr:esterase-like activity of phytase family protein [Romeriopsis navalis]MBE9028742.1 esterase-like activity of phytase family protein [Romeriopsis navalis LEGE 11480]
MLSLEHSYGHNGFTLKLFQLTLDGATKLSAQPMITETEIPPVRKHLQLKLKDLGIPLDNSEAVIFGPKLADDSQSLLIISGNNFRQQQANSFLLFRIRGLDQST